MQRQVDNIYCNPGASNYFWDYGDGISGPEQMCRIISTPILLHAPVSHTVKLTTTSFYSCTDVKTLDITVMPVPAPQFTATPTPQIFDPAGNT